MEVDNDNADVDETVHGGEGDTNCWLPFNDSSFIAEEDSNKTNREDEESSQFNYAARLGDLSCSLLDCEGPHDDTLEEGDVDTFVAKIQKRDQIIAKLTAALKQVYRQKGDGDTILNSLEQNLGSFAVELTNSNFLTTTVPKPAFIDANTSVYQATQTESFELFESDKIVKTPTSVRDVETSTSPPVIEDNEEIEVGIYSTAKQGRTPHHSTPTLGNQDMRINEKDNDDGIRGSHRRLSFAMNPDSLRLTYSPSIIEYEAESHGMHELSGPSGFSVLEISDLRLQVADVERKLEAEKRFLSEMTLEREQEREEFQRIINGLTLKYHQSKRDKEKLENSVEHQQMEINELEEYLRKKDLLEDELSNTNCQLQEAVEKVVELREIIKNHEEFIESVTKDSKAKKDAIELFELDPDPHSELCNEVCQQEDGGCMSEVDHFEELQAQVDDLAKKIEEKLMELENFSWQNRPNSSCSITGDDVSVRGATRAANCDNSEDARDLMSKVFAGLRRLEYSFNGLVRFEEVLLKKMKDAELKIAIDNKQVEELKVENGKLTWDLTTCHQKIQYFENFLKGNHTHNSFLNNSIERLRYAGVSFGLGVEDNSLPVLQHSYCGKKTIPENCRFIFSSSCYFIVINRIFEFYRS